MAPAILTTLQTQASFLLLLHPRGDPPDASVPGGVIPPAHINNNAIFALFGLIGVAFVVLGIWFFFWAKNGGFVFKENDWDDYKTTVLRRRGPNGTLLSGATESTQLGGGSVYKDVDDGSSEATPTVVTALTESTAMTGITAGVSDIGAREKRRKKKEQREREKERRREEKAREKEEYHRRKAGKRKVGEDGLLIDEEAEAAAKAQLRDYRHEKPARVGGLNKESEASEWDGSTNPSHSTMSQSQSGYGHGGGSDVTSELMGNRERTPTSTPTKKAAATGGGGASGGIRKVYSTAEKAEDRERERMRAEARKLQEKGRAARDGGGAYSATARRDFSYRQGDDAAAPLRPVEERGKRSGQTDRSRSRHRAAREDVESRVPGSWAESDIGNGSDLGTKVYQHSVHIPISSSAAASSVSGTSTSDFAYQEEKRKRRQGAGYRRNRDG
ncbi:hypothetical protein GE09DRAFT_1215491 [Coniochaeta sp. 2T2.1]|nr:hypothetical protein GE09DRAFT_1215491 [Coniochaeta sp. 2T2.1]